MAEGDHRHGCDGDGVGGSSYFQYIVVGGGIAGVTCAETLCALCSEQVLLLTASPVVKAVTNFRMVSKVLEEFDVEERPMAEMAATCPNVSIIQAVVTQLDSSSKEVTASDGKKYTYDKLCICAGGSPKVIAKDSPYVLGIRDTETVKVFQKRLANARRIVVVGNGGIATELVYEIENCEVVWAIKDSSITSTFIDAGAAKFCLPQLEVDKHKDGGPIKRLKYAAEGVGHTSNQRETMGSALGPDWSTGIPMHGSEGETSHHVNIEYLVEVRRLLKPEELQAEGLIPVNIHSSCDELMQKYQPATATTTSGNAQTEWPVYVQLTNDKVYGCDFVVSATGVVPNTAPFTKIDKFELAEDGGMKVNAQMQTSVSDVYAAGDVCTASWDPAPHWFQMRLWSQARQMGAYAAKNMVAHSKGEEVHMDFCFELFAHVTKFFNYKVVLLGKFKGQGLGTDQELLLRVTKGQEYVKTVMHEGRMHGCILIGETDLEETFENLILNQMDLSIYGEDLLDPNVDIEDYFD